MDASYFSPLKAILGPTNTGKTWFAIERMLAHRTGMIGLPLRLLAREVYQRVRDRVGADAVALVTGEERIVPKKPRYWVATVEAMPAIPVECLAVDEIQTAINFERGHIFTDRILNARGTVETLLLGAETMVPVVRALLPNAEIVIRPRLSELTYSGSRKLSRQPARSAIVAFSAPQVYALAELLRRERGGAAVVMGALSPRTRNAQVEMYQNGDVDYLVATDAIGMGLNLDVHHVAFADDHKFDGHQTRPLTPAEFGQIAGRAGRHLRDGTFGVTASAAPFEAELIQQLESHDFESVKVLQWRNPELNFHSLEALRQSLDRAPDRRGLTRVPMATDQHALEFVARNEGAKRATSPKSVELLWTCCQLPDYRNISPAQHGEIVTRIYTDLTDHARIDADWIAEQVSFCDNTSGDIDTLSNRIRQTRTWTFVANRRNWLEDPTHWREKTRDIEDRLSDALHERLTQRFVDRRTSVLIRHLRDRLMVVPEINERGEISLEGHLIGSIQGFRFTLARAEGDTDAKGLATAASQVVSPEIHRRAERLAGAPNEELVLATDGYVRWRGEIVAHLGEGESLLAPRILLLADESLTGPDLERVQDRLNLWLRHLVNTQLEQIVALAEPPDLEGVARGIAFRLSENLGLLARTLVSDEIKGLDQDVRAKMRKHGIKFGAYHIYVPQSLKPAPRELAIILFALKNGGIDQPGVSDLPQLVLSGRTSFVIDPEVNLRLYEIAGFKVAGKRAVRVDILERLADIIRPLIAFDPRRAETTPPPGAAEGNGFRVTVEMTSLLGCSGEDFASILTSLGYRVRRVPKPEIATVAPAPESANDDLVGAEDLAALAAIDGANPAQVIGEAGQTRALDSLELADAARLDGIEPEIEPATPGPGNLDRDAANVVERHTPVIESQPSEATARPTSLDVESHDEASDAVEQQPDEPKFDEIWSPGGRRSERNRDHRHGQRHRTAHAAPNGAAAAPAENAGAERPTHHHRRPRGENRDRHEANGDARSDAPEKKKSANVKPFGKRDAPPRKPTFDPDSPFAALAALRDRKPD